MRKNFIMVVGLEEIAFEEAEKTYKEELSRLQKKLIDNIFKSNNLKNNNIHVTPYQAY